MKEIKTVQELDEILSSENRRIFVKISATWCQPCKTLGRTISGIEEDYMNDYLFLEIDADEANSDLVEKMIVYNLPTIIIFSGEEEVYRCSGLLTKAQLTSLLDDYKQ